MHHFVNTQIISWLSIHTYLKVVSNEYNFLEIVDLKVFSSFIWCLCVYKSAHIIRCWCITHLKGSNVVLITRPLEGNVKNKSVCVLVGFFLVRTAYLRLDNLFSLKPGSSWSRVLQMVRPASWWILCRMQRLHRFQGRGFQRRKTDQGL